MPHASSPIQLAMNEQRLQAYNALIYTLLNSESGEKEAILNAQLELLDAELGKLMQVSAIRR
ncbi:hypothetical protein [Microcoleus sp. FACHB-68]|uniref:hypothetical protein n=1 Tax=Microcoleus sp. FACHB-68 TaxID=2692826 RepID=UPI001687A06C|nr:hypothetical protein [Microcoleus sp. FACHB-68]